MTRAEAWFVHASSALVGVTGIVYGWMRYFVEPEDDWAVVNHPLQPAWQHAHILVAPLLVFAAGLVWRRHVWAKFKDRGAERRRTGITLMVLLLPMTASGYLLQVAESELGARVWLVVHVASSSLFVLGYAVHQLSPRGAARVPARRGERRAATGEASRPAEPVQLARSARARVGVRG